MTTATMFAKETTTITLPKTSTMKPGDKMKDGTYYAGISPDTGKKLYLAPEDEGMLLSLPIARKRAEYVEHCGHKDWKILSSKELDMLVDLEKTGALKGIFDKAADYWSEDEISVKKAASSAFSRSFADGLRKLERKVTPKKIRYVRAL